MKHKDTKFEKYQFVLRFIFDAIAVVASWFVSYYLRFFVLPGRRRDSLDLFVLLSVVALLSSMVFIFMHRLYEPHITSSRSKETGAIWNVALDEFLLFVVFYYYIFDVKISRLALVLYAIILFFALFIGRACANSIIGHKVKAGKFRQRTLLVGYGEKLEEYYNATTIKGEAARIKVVGQYMGHSAIEGVSQISAESLEAAVESNNIDVVVIGFPRDAFDEKDCAVHQALEMLNVKVLLLPEIPDSYAGSKIIDYHSIQLMQLNSADLSFGKRFVKRSMDLVLCTLAVILLSPLYLLLAILVKVSSPGPVFFRQKRVTRDGKVFEMLKFRSMRTDMPEQNGPHWTEENDPRITKIGKILRKTSLDEIPQFFNVIGGSMSLIGPRPERPELVEGFKKTIPGYDIRHKMKAGISGWAQVNGLRGNTSIEDRISYDLYYVRNWSVLFDLRIVILTFFKGFINKNAY